MYIGRPAQHLFVEWPLCLTRCSLHLPSGGAKPHGTCRGAKPHGTCWERRQAQLRPAWASHLCQDPHHQLLIAQASAERLQWACVHKGLHTMETEPLPSHRGASNIHNSSVKYQAIYNEETKRPHIPMQYS